MVLQVNKSMQITSTTKGILFKLLGVGLFAPLYVAGKLTDGAFPALAIVVMRYIGGFLTVWVYIFASRTPMAALTSPKPSRHFARACLGVGGGAFIIHATTLMPVANATAIGLTEGIMIIGLAGLLLKETITIRHWLAGMIAMLGAGLVVSQSVDLSTGGLGSWEGILAAFAGALFMTLEALLIKYLSSREDPLRMLLYVNGFGSVVAVALVVAMHDWRVLLDPALLVFLSLGPLVIVAQFFNIRAFSLVNASTLAPIFYSWIVFAALLGLFLFDEVPTMITIVGSALIVVGGVVVARVR